MEDRTLLSVSALFSIGTGVLRVSSVDDNGPDSIEIGTDTGGNVQVIANGSPISGLNPSLSPSDVATIDVQGGDGSNLIDLSGVSTTDYDNPLLEIVVDGGNGHDTILGSADADDTLDGGHGNDHIVGGTGDNANADNGKDSMRGFPIVTQKKIHR